VSQHYGDDNPDPETQRVHAEVSAAALAEADIPARHVSAGLVIDSATPTRPTWQVIYRGQPAALHSQPAFSGLTTTTPTRLLGRSTRLRASTDSTGPR